MAKTLTTIVEKFIEAGDIQLANNNLSHESFIVTWKRFFERCLNEFGANYNHDEGDADNRDIADSEPESNTARNTPVQ